MVCRLGLDIGSNSVGSVWLDTGTVGLTTGISIFPAGVEESDEKRGDPKNAKRRTTRHSRITLARRSERKRELRMRLIKAGLLPPDERGFTALLRSTDPWELRRKGLDESLTPHQFGRVLLHLAQRRGAMGLKLADPDEKPEGGDKANDDGKVKAAIAGVRARMEERGARTFGEFIAVLRTERVTLITSEDHRPADKRTGPREWRTPVRNRAGNYELCADRQMIRCEFARLWDSQKDRGEPLAQLLTDELRHELDDESGDSVWRHKGLLFGQRRQSWDLGTLGRCVLEPTERCAPHADMYASRFLVVETVNNLRIVERGKQERSLLPDERRKILEYLSCPLGAEKPRRKKNQSESGAERPKTTVSVTSLRNLMGTSDQGWGKASKTSRFHFNIESDEDRQINTDWFRREIIHGAITPGQWSSMTEQVREGINRAILKHDPDDEADAARLKGGVMKWGGLSAQQADALIAAWKRRPRLDSRRLNMSRRAVRNILAFVDRQEPWPDPRLPGQTRWLTQIEARKLIAQDAEFRDVTTGEPLSDAARQRYRTGAKGATARDRHYMKKHVLKKNGEVILGPDGTPLAEPPPAPLISNPVVRKAIHEVRRHLIEYMIRFERKPDEIYIELAREARMGKKDADEALFRNRLRQRIYNDIIATIPGLDAASSTQQREAVRRVVLAVQQKFFCPLCGQSMVDGYNSGIALEAAAMGRGWEVAHVLPQAGGGDNKWRNVVLAHESCNRNMARRTPRDYWNSVAGCDFDKGISWVEHIFGDIARPNRSQLKVASGNSLWACYFTKRDDLAKVEQFKKDITDIQGMTERQEAATKYAARQVMAYLADALFEGRGLPERGGERRIFNTDGIWTARLRREWGLFFDPHDARGKGLTSAEEHVRREKNRGDHRHHAVDAIVTALCSREVQLAWEIREKKAASDGVNAADGAAMENYRRLHPLPLPAPFKNREELRDVVRQAVFGGGEIGRAICHRPAKRKLTGAFHEETLFGPVLDRAGQLTEYFTAKKSVLQLEPNHLRMPRQETRDEAVERLALRRRRSAGADNNAARKWALAVISSPGYRAATVDPPPGKSGIVRDVALRRRIRECLKGFTSVGEGRAVNPDDFTDREIKQACEQGKICHKSGVPIRSVVLLRTMTDPVTVDRRCPDYATGKLVPCSGTQTKRAYLGGNNHHIEVRVSRHNHSEKWTGTVVTAFQSAQRKLKRLRALRAAGIPDGRAFRRLSKAQRAAHKPAVRAAFAAHPIVDRSDNADLGGSFVMSLCEGEMLFMKHKHTGETGYFVVAKLEKPQRIVLVPHWDARAAGERKDASGRKIPASKREQFTITPHDLRTLAPPGREHAIKVRVSPLGVVTELHRD